jgi:pentose-5-phosphate-3-epimerase
MQKVLNKKINFFYNAIFFYRFFFTYVLIGFFSILFEIFIFKSLNHFFEKNFIINLISLTFGILFAFILNFFFNFRIHKSRIKVALLYFITISLFSFVVQKFISLTLNLEKFSYEKTRIITSFSFFLVAYFLHRKFSFKDYKKLGIAFYLDNKINLNRIFQSIKNYPDFIHLDIIDHTFSKNKIKNNTSLINKIRTYWPNHEFHTHIMSKKPSLWLDSVLNISDVIFIHYEIDENINILKNKITEANKTFGLAVTLTTNPKKILNILKSTKILLILSVDKPGFSGQNFNIKAFEYIKFLNSLKFRKEFKICVDGGINDSISKILKVDSIVSASSVLNSHYPIDQILQMKSSSRYGY